MLEEAARVPDRNDLPSRKDYRMIPQGIAKVEGDSSGMNGRPSMSLRSDDGSPDSSGFLPEGASSRPSRRPTCWGKASTACHQFWVRNRPVLLVAMAEFFAATMNLCARLLELEGQRMHMFQILFMRMSITVVVLSSYMHWAKTPHFPLGSKDVRWLLVLRGACGFFGLFGMWFSMMYLPLAEATVITFLAPGVASYLCYLILREPFTRKEQIASFAALAGVILIARPVALFTAESGSTASEIAANATTTVSGRSTAPPSLGEEASPSQRFIAIAVALIGVLGGSGAITSIRWIGARAHPLLSVNYFSTAVLLASTAALILGPVLDIDQPLLRFDLPHSPRQWLLLLAICVCGFATQFLVTAGLGAEKSNRATAMVYTQMLFAAGYDRWIFGHDMGLASLLGCGMIIGSALWAVLTKKASHDQNQTRAANEDLESATLQPPEAIPLASHVTGDDDDEYEYEEDRNVEGTRMDSIEQTPRQ